MKYENTKQGKFHSRPNRFIAHVWLDGNLETVHVKNTGCSRDFAEVGQSGKKDKI